MKGILLDDDYKIQVEPEYDDDGKIVSGVVIGNIDYQRAAMIIDGFKGDVKEAPTLGFNIERFIRSSTVHVKQQFVNELKKELKSDGLTPEITVSDDLSELEINLE